MDRAARDSDSRCPTRLAGSQKRPFPTAAQPSTPPRLVEMHIPPGWDNSSLSVPGGARGIIDVGA